MREQGRVRCEECGGACGDDGISLRGREDGGSRGVEGVAVWTLKIPPHDAKRRCRCAWRPWRRVGGGAEGGGGAWKVWCGGVNTALRAEEVMLTLR
eukprot:347602-Chlamydomonas_euryale.AAC.2